MKAFIAGLAFPFLLLVILLLVVRGYQLETNPNHCPCPKPSHQQSTHRGAR